MLQINLKRICFIDDSKTSAFVTKKMLRQHGYAVDHFPDAETALEALMENDYALIITDLMISSDGGVNGDDLIRLVRHSGHPIKSLIPIIVVTGTADQDILNDLIKVGANTVLQKPLNGESLNKSIQALIQSEEPHYETELIETHTRVEAEPVYQPTEVIPDEIPEVPVAVKPSEPVRTVPTFSMHEYSSDLASTRRQAVAGSNKSPVNKSSESQQIPVLTSVVETSKAQDSSQSIGDEIESLLASTLSASMNAELENIQKTDVKAAQENKIQVLETPSIDAAVTVAESAEIKEKPPQVNQARVIPESKPAVPKTESDHAENPLLALLDHMDDGSFEDGFKKSKVQSPLKQLQRFKFNEWVPKAISGLVILAVLIPAIYFWMMTQKVIEVSTFKVEKGEIHNQISVPGRIDSKRKIKVSARESGQLVKVSVKEGDTIQKDQVMAQLDDSEALSNIKRAQARLLSIEEEVSLTSKTQERLQRALDVGAVSRQMVEDAEASWKTASAKQSVVEEELKSAELKRDRLKIRAPFDGIVTAVFAQEGQWVSQSEDLFTLVDMNQKIVEISVDAADSTSLRVGQTVVLRSGAFDGHEWNEAIVKIGSAAKSENSANVITVTASLSKDAPELRVGQQVDAEIRTSSRSDALLLPYDVIFNNNGQQTVAVIENGSIVFVPIETGIESFTRIEIVRGLRAGQLVVIPTGIPLEPGMSAISTGVQTL